jgi:hypothetical protein
MEREIDLGMRKRERSAIREGKKTSGRWRDCFHLDEGAKPERADEGVGGAEVLDELITESITTR